MTSTEICPPYGLFSFFWSHSTHSHHSITHHLNLLAPFFGFAGVASSVSSFIHLTIYLPPLINFNLTLLLYCRDHTQMIFSSTWHNQIISTRNSSLTSLDRLSISLLFSYRCCLWNSQSWNRNHRSRYHETWFGHEGPFSLGFSSHKQTKPMLRFF